MNGRIYSAVLKNRLGPIVLQDDAPPGTYVVILLDEDIDVRPGTVSVLYREMRGTKSIVQKDHWWTRLKQWLAEPY